MAADGSIIIDTRLNTAGFGKGAANLKAQFNLLGSSVKKLGRLIAAAFSVSAIVAFSKEAIELGSNLQEVQNVVDVTFTTMNEQVDAFAKSATKTAGLSETMAKRYAGTFGAMAKSFRFTEEEAYSMSTALTQLVGDVASFYNITQDEAYTKLSAVFTGETEALKNLGVAMTQTALDDFALRKGLGKTASAMTEQEKVALRYQFVMEQLAGASGDFLRTSDSWANQTRLLSLQFDQLKATVGQGLINALTPAIKAVNTLLERFQKFADSFLDFTIAAFGNTGSASAGISATAESAGELAENIEAAGKAAKKYLTPFDEIVKLGSEAESGSSVGSIAGAALGGTTTIGVDAQDNVSPVIERISEKMQELLAPLQSIDFSPLMGALANLGVEFGELGEKISGALEWSWFNILTPLATWAIEDLAPASVDTLSAALDTLSDSLDVAANGIEELYAGAQPIFAWLGETAVIAIAKIKERFESWGDWLEKESPQITGICKNLGSIISNVWIIAEPALTSLRSYWGMVFDRITSTAQKKASAIVSNLKIITDFLSSEMMKGVYNNIAGYINAILEIVTNGINSIIDAANTLSFEVPEWVPAIGGQTFGFELERISAPQIPYLAKGAVIPPNAPFMAVLGDQKHGNNIEAPEDLIRRIVREESANASSEEVPALLRQLIDVVCGIEVGDSTIGQAANRFNAKMAVITGGNA